MTSNRPVRAILGGVIAAVLLIGAGTVGASVIPTAATAQDEDLSARVSALECRVDALEADQPPSVCEEPEPTTAPPTTTTAPPTTTQPPVTTTPPAPGPDATFQAEAGAPWTYTGTWLNGSGDRYTRQAGATATLTFTGTGVRLYGVKAPWHGIATVAIDGGTPVDVDQYATARQDGALIWTSPSLANGPHTLVVTHTARRNPAATVETSGQPFSLDRAVVSTVGTGQPPTTTTPPTTTPPVTTTPPTPGAMPAITTQGNQIMRGGVPWYFTGTNSFVWTGNCGNPEERMTQAQVDAWLAGMRDDGHAAVRLFFFSGWDIADLDAAVASAKRHNVYLTITLDDAIGGCGETDKTPAWFTNTSEVATYEAHMRNILTRYRGETAIAWLEFFNEPGGDGTASQLRAFYDRMGAVAAQVDPARLFASGTVAPYWVGGEAAFLNIHQSPGVDIASLHEYDQTEVESNHGPRVRANSAGKPVIVGEFGITANQAGSGCVSFATRAARFAAKLEVYTGPNYAGGFAWAWQPGNGGGSCEYGNVDADTASQAAIRDATR